MFCLTLTFFDACGSGPRRFGWITFTTQLTNHAPRFYSLKSRGHIGCNWVGDHGGRFLPFHLPVTCQLKPNKLSCLYKSPSHSPVSAAQRFPYFTLYRASLILQQEDGQASCYYYFYCIFLGAPSELHIPSNNSLRFR